MMRGLLICLGIAVAVWVIGILVLIALGRRSQARELATLIPNLLALFSGLLRDPRVPRGAKFWLGFAVVWFASPVDLIPEFVPIAGPLDDAIVAALVLRHLLKRTAPAVVAEHWRGDPKTLEMIVRVRSTRRTNAQPSGERSPGRSRAFDSDTATSSTST